jgi:hypothetical protein
MREQKDGVGHAGDATVAVVVAGSQAPGRLASEERMRKQEDGIGDAHRAAVLVAIAPEEARGALRGGEPG